MRVTVDEARHDRLAAAVVDVGSGILLENRVRGADRDDAIGLHGERNILLNRVGIDHHRVGEHDDPAGGLLRLRAARIE